jgi:hypothetical protein
MATTNVQGIIVTSDGKFHHVEVEPTDAAAASALTIRDVGGVKHTWGDYLAGKTITDVYVQLSDGSILTQLYFTNNGERTRDYLAGERLAGSSQNYNLILRGIREPINKTCTCMIVTND